jgi:two-component sensor histidine kinase
VNPIKSPIEDLFTDPKHGHLLTRAIIDTIREPLLVLNKDLHVLVASPSFYKTFQTLPSDTEGKLVYELGNGQWNIPALRGLLKGVIPNDATVDAFEVEHDFPSIGRRTMLLSSREILYENDQRKSLVTIYDVTVQRDLEAQAARLIKQKDMLLKEMRHRVANSLQLIASILLIKAGIVESEETRKHLEDAHERIMSIATVQKQLDPGSLGDEVKVAPYLQALCASLARSMVGGRRPITIEVKADEGTVSSEAAISFGLLATELIINSIKHAFPNNRSGCIRVSFESRGTAWVLNVSDDGIGHPKLETDEHLGLGTSIVAALADQLKAVIQTESGPRGTKVSFTHTELASNAPLLTAV